MFKRHRKMDWKKASLAAVLVSILALLVGYQMVSTTSAPAALKESAALSLKSGNVLRLPASCVSPYDGSEVVDGHAQTKKEALEATCEGLLEVPIEPKCPRSEAGVVGAPSDWTKACWFEAPEGGLALVGHAVRGPRLGAMERIGDLPLGTTVEIGPEKFTVESVNDYPVLELPKTLWKEGSLSLITCLVGDDGEQITSNVVVTLTPA